MLKFDRARLSGAKSVYDFAGLGLIALLSACSSQPATTNNAVEAVIDNVANVSNEAVAPVVNETAAATNAANAVEAPVAPIAAVATPKPTPTPVAAKTETAAAEPAGDAAAGAKLFMQCKVCHSTEPGKNGLGPSLHGVVGRKSASLAGFDYSAAMEGSGINWTDATLNDYLRAPMKKVPGTKMAFGGMSKDKDRADLIAYLDTLK
jgi:cytochrome c2